MVGEVSPCWGETLESTAQLHSGLFIPIGQSEIALKWMKK